MYVQVDNSPAQYPVTPTVSSPGIPVRKSVSSSSLQARQLQRPAGKKETKTVRCNLCHQTLQNDQESLLEHVQRMHGA